MLVRSVGRGLHDELGEALAVMATLTELLTQALPPARRRKELGVPPTQPHGLVHRGSRWSNIARSAGDLPGQPLGFIPIVSGRRSRALDLVGVQVADRRRARRLI
jgi:hypothetical protein